MAEWSIAAVLKTVEGHTSGGSNPSLSANNTRVCDNRETRVCCFQAFSFSVMSKETEKLERKRMVALIASVVAAMVIYGVAAWFFGMTLVEVWKVLACGASVALLTLIPLRRGRGAVWCVVYIILVAGLMADLALGVNYYLRNEQDSSEVVCEVVGLYSEKRTRTRRINRRIVGRGEPYSVYYMDVRMPDGSVRKRQLTLSRYNYMSRKRVSKIKVCVTPGFLNWPLVDFGQ